MAFCIRMTLQKFHATVFLLVVAAFIFMAGSAAQARILKGPWLLDVRERSATIKWESEAPGGYVEYGSTPEYGTQLTSYFEEGVNTVRLHCIRPEEVIYYRVVDGSESSSANHFNLVPEDADEPFMFVAFGDTREHHADHQLVVDAIVDKAPAFVIHTGDLVDYGFSQEEWQMFFDVEKNLLGNTPYLAVMGNHELWGGRQTYLKYFNSPSIQPNGSQYSLQYGNTQLIGLDITLPYGEGSVQMDWMITQLADAAKNSQIVHCVVFLHYPPFSSSNHGDEYDPKKVRADLVPVWEEYGVDLVLGGHDHNYERSEVNGQTYIVTGGGGAPLYSAGVSDWTVVSAKTLHYLTIDVNGPLMDVQVLDPEGTEIDSFQINQDFGGAGDSSYTAPGECDDYDFDNDGLTDGVEAGMCTDIYTADTDGDGWKDGDEVSKGTDPCDKDSYPDGDPPADDDDDTGDDDDNDDAEGDDDDDDSGSGGC